MAESEGIISGKDWQMTLGNALIFVSILGTFATLFHQRLNFVEGSQEKGIEDRVEMKDIASKTNEHLAEVGTQLNLGIKYQDKVDTEQDEDIKEIKEQVRLIEKENRELLISVIQLQSKLIK